MSVEGTLFNSSFIDVEAVNDPDPAANTADPAESAGFFAVEGFIGYIDLNSVQHFHLSLLPRSSAQAGKFFFDDFPEFDFVLGHFGDEFFVGFHVFGREGIGQGLVEGGVTL
jgi:hypothetical protein